MKWINKTLLIVFIIFGVNGCSDKQIENSILHAEIAISGYKAPKFFHFTAPQYVDRWYSEDKHYTALPPRTYQKDWIKMQGWKGAFINNTIVLSNDNKHIHGEGIDLGYGILFSCSVSKCTDRERDGKWNKKTPFSKKNS